MNSLPDQGCALKTSRWTQEEIDILCKLYGDHRAQDIAVILSRPLVSVKSRIYRMRLLKRKSRKMRHWCAEDDLTLRTLYAEGWALKDISLRLKRTVAALTPRLEVLGIRKRKTVYPIGYEFNDKDGLRWRKVDNQRGIRSVNWKRVDVIEWEAVNGPLPEGYTLMVINKYLPRTTTNVRLLKKEDVWATLTGDHLPPEARELVVLKRQIEREAKKQSQK